MKDTLRDRFKVNRVIGEGVYTKVYDAYDKLTERACALKIFVNSRTLMENEESELRFLREIDILKSLKSDYVVNIVENGRSDGSDFWYTMDLKEGSLRDLLISESIQSDFMKFSISIQCLFSLEFIHNRNIIHRDIKPENFLYTVNRENDDLSFYLSDFGYSKPAFVESTLTRSGIGSLLYASPEAAYKKGKVSVKSDIYSIGKVLYEIFTNAPFGDIRDFRSSSSCPSWLFSICSTASHNSPSLRYDNIFDLSYNFISNAFNSMQHNDQTEQIIKTTLRVTAGNPLTGILEKNLSLPLNLTDILIICSFPHIKDFSLLKDCSAYLSKVITKFDKSTQKSFLKIFSESLVNGDYRYIEIDENEFSVKSKMVRSFAFSALRKFLFK